jgi:hypothetical protein
VKDSGPVVIKSLVSGYRIRDPLNRLTQRELGGFQDFSI